MNCLYFSKEAKSTYRETKNSRFLFEALDDVYGLKLNSANIKNTKKLKKNIIRKWIKLSHKTKAFEWQKVI